jgi:hypothetical protein
MVCRKKEFCLRIIQGCIGAGTPISGLVVSLIPAFNGPERRRFRFYLKNRPNEVEVFYLLV